MRLNVERWNQTQQCVEEETAASAGEAGSTHSVASAAVWWWVVWCLSDRCKATELALLHQTYLCSLDKSFLFFFVPFTRRKKQSGLWRGISGSLRQTAINKVPSKSATQTNLSGRNDSLSTGKQLCTSIMYIPHFRNTLYSLLVS